MKLAGALALLLVGCAEIPEERQERDRALLAAAESCARQFSGMRVMSVNRDGRLYIEIMDRGDVPAFDRCYQEAVSRSPEVGALTIGRVAFGTRSSSVSAEIRGAWVVVPALVNGVKATLLVDAGALVTVVRPSLAQRAGIEPLRESPWVRVRVRGSEPLSVPLVRARSLVINAAAVDALDVGVHEVLSDLPDVDGVLGANFLRHFRVTLDKEKRELLFAPVQAAKPL